MLRYKAIKMYEEDEDLIDDVLIELQQAIEMCSISTTILANTMDAFSSVISGTSMTSTLSFSNCLAIRRIASAVS